MISPLIKSVSENELLYIAALDYEQECSQHLAALRKVVFEQDGIISASQIWHPYEVIELGANSFKAGHEREFAICTLMVIQAVAAGVDLSTDLSAKFSARTQDYDALPSTLKEEILHAYEISQC
jgi:hypothetical protein